MAYVEVEGLKEFQRLVRQAKDKDLDKRLGQANKRIGQLVIDRLSPSPDPLAVGAGRGANVRPSASKREVLLRVGGGHRAAGVHTNKQPWGAKRVARPGTSTPRRPFIQRTAEVNFDEISDMWLDATMDAFNPAFASGQR